MRYTLTTIFLFCFAGLYAQVNTTEVEEFIKEYVKEHRADETKIRAILNEAQFQQEIIDKISRPAEGTMTWERYRKIFVTEERTQAGLEF